MRKLLLATSAAALVLTFAGRSFAEPTDVSTTVAPPAATTPDGLVFSKDAEQAKPIDKPAEQQAQPADQPAPAAAATTLSAEDAAVADRLKELVENKLSQYVPHSQDRAGVLAFYRDRNFAPIWVASGKPAPRAEQASSFLRGVAADGLDPADYPAPSFGNTDPDNLAADELAMTNSVVMFSRHASIGRVAFTRVSGAVYYDRKAPSAADVLGKLLDSTDVRATLDGFNPQSRGYKALKAELAAVRSGKTVEAKTASTATKAQDGKTKKGHRTETGKAPAAKATSSDTIIANMERWRWMPHDLGAAYVMVNIPDYTLKLVQNGKTVWQTKIVVGKPGTHATPLIAETMKYITVNPTWNVPPSIIRNEYLPALAQDPNALSRVGLKVTHNPDGSIRIYQPPGERNALGRIRFNFPNRFLVYQHDTPDKNLFAKTERAYSHGCMRVQNPDQYAEALLSVSQPEDKYTAKRISSMYGNTERSISFKHPIPVYVTYQTAFTDDAGKPQARADIYGLDRDVLKVLRSDGRNSDTPIARNYNTSTKPVMSSAVGSGRGRDYGLGASTTAWDSDRPQQNFRSAYQPPDRNRIW